MKKTKLEKIFKKYNIILAYQFGSSVKGITSELSDLDIAVLFEKEEPSFKILHLLLEDLRKCFGNENIDLCRLNHASPVLKHVVASEGVLLYEKKEDLDKAFATRALQEYEDTQRLRYIYLGSIKERVGYEQVI